MKNHIFFFGAALLFYLWNKAKSCFSVKKAQLELPTPPPLHPPPLISIVFFYKISRTRTKKSFLKIQTQTWAHELPDMQPPWKYSVFLWFWLCFRTRISETLHFLRISCPGGHPQVRGGVGFSKLPMGPLFFLHTPCFHKLLLRFSHYPKQASEPGREPWPRPFWPMTFLPLACATHLASPLTRLHSSPLTPDPSPSPGLLTPWPLSLESLPLAPRPLTLTNELWHLALSPGPWTFTLCPGAIDVEMQDHTVNP